MGKGARILQKILTYRHHPLIFKHAMTKFQSNLRLPYIGNMTCGQFSRYGLYAHIFHKGECVDANGEEGCGGHGCRASKTVCESKGFTFKPLTQSMIDNVPTSHM